VHDDHAFNEYLEVVYDRGIVALGVLGVFGYLAGRAVLSADLFAGALAVWALTMAGSITLRTWPFPLVGALLLLGAWWP
jgi:hypothetical protein